MRYAICNETFQGWEFSRACDFARACGYTGIEIAPFTFSTYATEITSSVRQEIVRQAAAAEMQIVGLHWLLAKTEGFYLTSPDKSVRAKTAQYFQDLARLCRDLGGSIMVLGSPQQRNLLPGVTLEKATEYAQMVIESCLPAFEKCQITLALEPLGPAEGDFLLTAAEAVKLIREIDSQHVRLHLDCKAMSSEAVDIPTLIKRHCTDMVHFHANDPNRQGPGFGNLDFHPIMSALADVQYSGWVSVEVFDYTPGVENLVTNSIQHLRSMEQNT